MMLSGDAFTAHYKEQVTLRIDADVLAWFRAGGNKYQTRINAALREYIRTHPER